MLFLNFIKWDASKLSGLTLFSLFTTIIMIAVGSIVRVTGHGLGCPDWPLCYGQAIPPLADYSAWIEFSHRAIGVIVGIEFVLILLLVIKYYSHIKILLFVAVLANVLFVVQVVLGGIHVILEIPPVTGWIHTGNALLLVGLVSVIFSLANSITPVNLLIISKFVSKRLFVFFAGVTLIGLIFHMYLTEILRASNSGICESLNCDNILRWTSIFVPSSVSLLLLISLTYVIVGMVNRPRDLYFVFDNSVFYWLVSIAVVSLYSLLLSGSFVTRSGASLACLGFPLCGSESHGIRYLVDIQLLHRYLALVVGLILLWIVWLCRVVLNGTFDYIGFSIVVLLVMQGALGAANVILRIPMWSRVLHLTVGTSLWVCVCMLWTLLTLIQYKRNGIYNY